MSSQRFELRFAVDRAGRDVFRDRARGGRLRRHGDLFRDGRESGSGPWIDGVVSRPAASVDESPSTFSRVSGGHDRGRDAGVFGRAVADHHPLCGQGSAGLPPGLAALGYRHTRRILGLVGSKQASVQ